MSANTHDRLQRGSSFNSSKRSKLPSNPRTTSAKNIVERAGDDNTLAVGDRPYNIPRPRTGSTSSQSLGRTPGRSFYHRSFHGQLQPAQYSSDGLRDRTAELASFAISDSAVVPDSIARASESSSDDGHPEAIEEVSEPTTPDADQQELTAEASSSAARTAEAPVSTGTYSEPTTSSYRPVPDTMDESALIVDENTRLLGRKLSRNQTGDRDVESQNKSEQRSPRIWHVAFHALQSCTYTLSHPKTWNARTIWQEVVVHPVRVLPAVFLGLLLNILDALSYGMILFPLGTKLFNDLGTDGISMFYVSTIVAQVVYSAGGSVFRGGIGSEMIEVVPFFHQMALSILREVGEENSKSVLATTILAFAVSSILTGLVFFLMGASGLGSLIGFFPRHILIGCIGGVGWFLVATGIEVSARLPGSLEYNLPTLKQLFRGDTVPLWITPLGIAVILLIIQRFYKSNFLVGAYFISVAFIFYIVKFAFGIRMETLHDHGWVFDSPPAGKPWYHFYTLYDLGEVHWGALAQTIPAMFALTFFGILHVPINVPALGISTGEDNLNVDRELIAHGISNCVSGLFGSIQNYLAYTNSLLFIDSGGDDRLAGLLLAAATFGIMLAGPVIIGYIPVMVVGALIFLLGIELLEEAIVDTFGKVHRLEYATILIIVVTMGVYDFVAGILVGIVLAALSFVV